MKQIFKDWLEEHKFSTTFSNWHFNKLLPICEFEKKYYFVYEGKLTAFMFIEAVLTQKYKGSTWCYHLKVAGQGDVFIEEETLTKIGGYFNSVEEYQRFIDGELKLINFIQGDETRSVTYEILCGLGLGNRQKREASNCYNSAYGFVCDKGNTSALEADIEITEFSYSADGVFVTSNWTDEEGRTIYPTYAKAIESAKVVEVVDFDEEVKEIKSRYEMMNEIETLTDFRGGVSILPYKETFVLKNGEKVVIKAIARVGEGDEGCRMIALDETFENWDIDDYFSTEEIEKLYKIVFGIIA